MVMTVPELARDALESLVEPDVLMRDDGCTDYFAKAFIYDDMPVIEVDDDLGSVMRLTDPTLTGVVDLPFWDAPLPIADDGLDLAWFVDAVRYVVPELPVAIAAPVDVLCIGAPAGVPGLCAPTETLCILPPVPVPTIAAPCAVLEDAAEEVPDVVDAISEPVEDIVPVIADVVATVEGADPVVPLVTFTFGPSKADAGGWGVSFTF